jgi:hypothetical protein
MLLLSGAPQPARPGAPSALGALHLQCGRSLRQAQANAASRPGETRQEPRKMMSPVAYRAALKQLRLSATAAASLLGVSGQTSRRWASTGSLRGGSEILLRLLLAERISAADIRRALARPR